MDFDPTLLVLSLLPSGVGFVLFTYGRKQHRFPQLLCGLLLMIYPYFVGSIGGMVSVGIFLCAALYFMVAAGW